MSKISLQSLTCTQGIHRNAGTSGDLYMCISNGPEAKKYNESSSSASQLVTSHFMNLSVNSKFGKIVAAVGLLRIWMNLAIWFASQMSGYFELLQRGKLDLWSHPARLARVDPWRSCRQSKDKTLAVSLVFARTTSIHIYTKHISHL